MIQTNARLVICSNVKSSHVTDMQLSASLGYTRGVITIKMLQPAVSCAKLQPRTMLAITMEDEEPSRLYKKMSSINKRTKCASL